MTQEAIHSTPEQASQTPVACRSANGTPWRWRYRLALAIGVIGVAAATYAIGEPRSEATASKPELVLLLSVMVLIKGTVAGAVISFVFWRMSHSIDTGTALAYLLGVLPLTASIVWLWSLSQIPLASLVFYASLAGLVFVAHIDKALFDALCLSFGREGRLARAAAFGGIGRQTRTGPGTGDAHRK